MEGINHRDRREEVIEKISLCPQEEFSLKEITEKIIVFAKFKHSNA
jgi:hypothetical protein